MEDESGERRKMKFMQRCCLSKVAHKYKTSAEYALDQMTTLPNSKKLQVYTCPICGLFHIGKSSDFYIKKEKLNILNKEDHG